MPDASAAPAEASPAENGTAVDADSAAPAESADGATPMETEGKEGSAAEVVKKKRTKKHSVPYKTQGVAGLSDKAVQVMLLAPDSALLPC